VFDTYDIKYDDFIRTTEERHRESVHHLWKVLVAKGFIYMGKHESWYCVSDESFLTDTQVRSRSSDDRAQGMISNRVTAYMHHFFFLSYYLTHGLTFVTGPTGRGRN
jgi:leucyl-tRNA synthetase